MRWDTKSSITGSNSTGGNADRACSGQMGSLGGYMGMDKWIGHGSLESRLKFFGIIACRDC